MAIEKMRLIRLAGSYENIEKILLTAFSFKELHPELAAHVVNEGNQGQFMREDNRYSDYLSRIESIANSLHCEFDSVYKGDVVYSDQEIEAYIDKLENRYEKINEQLMSMSSLTKEDKEAIDVLREYDLESLNHLEYTKVEFGRLPVSSLPKLALHRNEQFVYSKLHRNQHYVWIMIITTKEDHDRIMEIFDHLYFEPIGVPKVDDQALLHACEVDMGRILGYVRYCADIRKLYKYIAIYDDTCVITAFVPTRCKKEFKTKFGDMEDVVIQDFPAELEEGLKPPTILKNNWFARPFELFTEMYGLPHYSDFDPTFFMSVTYSLLFGLMFGDLGQGLVLVLAGAYLWHKKKMKLGAIGMRIGMFSMFFGTLFGSVFGNEELLNPLYTEVLGFSEKPIHVLDGNITMTLLIATVTIGATLILSSILYNIYGNMRRKDYGEVLFSQNGVAGFLFYGTIFAGLGLEYYFQISILNPIIIGLFIVTPVLIILFRVPLKNVVEKHKITPHEGWGGYLVESFFEVFEILLSFVSNTMSFLRVGGFILSHAGMMVVVVTLNQMAGSAGWLVMIVGNIFVIGLEGLIVGIQTLRLEYYEMFSRYFQGGGKKFVPVSISHIN